MSRRWPENRVWVVVPTSSSADWGLAVTVLAAASSAARVAVITVGGTGVTPSGRVATAAGLHDGERDPLRLADALRIVDAVARTHELVLVAGVAGLLAPAGRVGWTTADLAAALGAPAVVVAGEDPRGVNYTTVEALEARGLASALVTVGEAPKQLPIEPAGRIPAHPGAVVDAETARGYLEPMLHATGGAAPAGRRTALRPGVQTSDEREWPAGGAWVVAPAAGAESLGTTDTEGSATASAAGPATTSAERLAAAGAEGAVLDVEIAATVLAAASTARVAAVAIGVTGPPAARSAAHVGTWIGLRGGAEDDLRREDVAAVVEALGRTHELVLVIGATGALEPAGSAGWSLVDLAGTLGAPVVVVVGGEPGDTSGDASGDVGRVLGVIDGRGLRSAVVTVGGAAPGDGPSAAGWIPAGTDHLDGESARALLNPRLHATPAAVPLPPPPAFTRPALRRTGSLPRTGALRAVLLMVAIFVIMSLAAVGLAYCNRTPASPDAAPEPGAARQLDEPPPVVHWTPPEPPSSPENLCPENALTGAPARPDPDTTARVDAAWTRIEAWLAARAPESHRSLGPPARADDVDAAQRRMSVAFPPDLVASLLRHDGAEEFALPPGFSPIAVTEIVGDWTMLCGIMSDIPDLYDRWWSPDVVPFAEAGTGDLLVADQRPGSHGRVGEFFHEDQMEFTNRPASVLDLLERTATALETGQPFAGGVRPVVEDGYLYWS